jgi:hypothetical protein
MLRYLPIFDSVSEGLGLFFDPLGRPLPLLTVLFDFSFCDPLTTEASLTLLSSLSGACYISGTFSTKAY